MNTIKEKYNQLIPGTYDKMFKVIFTDNDTKDYMASMISQITKIPFDILKKHSVIKNNELITNHYETKDLRTDVLINVGECYINVEMNRTNYKGLSDRNLLYQSTIASQLLKKGEKYIDTPIIYQINFNNFKQFNNDKVINECLIMEKETHEIETEKFIRYHINIERAKEKWYNDEEITHLEKMIALLDIDSKKDAIELVKGDIIMEQALNKIDKMSNDDEFRLDWDYERDKQMIENSIRYTIQEEAKEEGLKLGKEQGLKLGKEQGLKLGKEEGIKEGKLEGIKEGKLEGIKEGKLEGKTESLFQVAKNMIEKQMPLDIISELTGLTIEEIKNINN